MWLLLCSLLSPLRVPLLLSVVQVRIIQFHCLVRSWGLSEGHSAFAQPVCTVYQTVVWLCVFILVICPVVMQLVCITHFFVCQTLSLSLFKAALPPWMFQGCAFHWCGLHRHSSHLYVHYTVCCCYVFLLTSTWMAIQPATFTEWLSLMQPSIIIYNTFLETVSTVWAYLEWRFAFPCCGVYMCLILEEMVSDESCISDHQGPCSLLSQPM